MLEAANCLKEATAARIDDRGQIPAPSASLPEEQPVAVPIQTALKAALYLAVRENGITPSELARRLGLNEKEAHQSRLAGRSVGPALGPLVVAFG